MAGPFDLVPGSAPGFSQPRIATSPLNNGPGMPALTAPAQIPKLPGGGLAPPLTPTAPAAIPATPLEPGSTTHLEPFGGAQLPFSNDPYKNPYLDLLIRSPQLGSPTGPSDERSLVDRFWLDFDATQAATGASAGQIANAAEAGLDRQFYGPDYTPQLTGPAARQSEYESMRPAQSPLAWGKVGPFSLPYISPQGVLETGAAAAGVAAGLTVTPETFLFGPEAGVVTKAARAISPKGLLETSSGALKFFGRLLNTGVSGAAVNATVDPAIQAVRIAAGLQPTYSPTETLQAAGMGLAIAPGFQAGGEAALAAKTWIGSFLMKNMPIGDALTILRDQGLTDAAIKAMTPAMRAKAISDFATQQIATKPPATAQSAPANPFLKPGEAAGKPAEAVSAPGAPPAPASAAPAATPAPPAPVGPKITLSPEEKTGVQSEVQAALDQRRQNLEALGQPPAEISQSEADIKAGLQDRIEQAAILNKAGLNNDQIAAMSEEERAAAVARAEAGQPATPPPAEAPLATPDDAARGVPAPPAAPPPIPEFAPDVPAAPNASRETPVPSEPQKPFGYYNDKKITFPDVEHARLYAMGFLVNQGLPVDGNEAKALLDAFTGYAAIDPAKATLLNDYRELTALAAGYYRDTIARTTGAGEEVDAGDVLASDEARSRWTLEHEQKNAPPDPAAKAVADAQAGAGGKPLPVFDAAPPPPTPGERAGIYLFDPRELKTDAGTFQFKDNGDANGVTPILKNVTSWDADAAGQLVVWQRNDGTLFVGDGHQRVALANRLLDQGVEDNIRIPASLYRESDGFSAESVMMIAAMKNIREGSGSIMDAAKILRVDPAQVNSIAEIGREQTRQAVALTSLSNDVWRMAVNHVIEPRDAAVIGRVIPQDHDLQAAAAQAVAKFKPANSLETELLVNRVKQSDLVRAEQGAQGSLLDDMTAPESTVGEEISIVGRTIKTLAKDKNILRRVAKNASTIEKVGSKIAREATVAAADESAALADIMQKVSFTKGEQRTALLKLAKEVKGGSRTVNDAVEAYIGALRGAEKPGATGGSSLGGRGAGNEADGASLFGADRIGQGPAPTEAVNVTTGTLLTSQSGRELAPVPKIDFSTPESTAASLKRVDKWLWTEAKNEARGRKLSDLDRIKGMDPKALTQPDRDFLNQYLFGNAEGVTRANLLGGESAPVKRAAMVEVDSAAWTGETHAMVEPAGGRAAQIASPAFKKWFGASKIVGPDGKPLPMFHATGAEIDFDRFRLTNGDVGIHFGTIDQANDRVAFKFSRGRAGEENKPQRLIPVYLKITNPLRMDDLGSWSADNMKFGLKRALPADAAYIERNLNTLGDMRRFIESKGYDGIVYRNTGEVKGGADAAAPRNAAHDALVAAQKARGKSPNVFDLEDQKTPEYKAYAKAEADAQAYREANAEDSYIILHPNQAKSAIANTGEFNPKNPAISAMVEPGADGKAQGVLPGAERISTAQLAARRASQPLRARAPQTRDAGPLFGDESKQLDLVDMAKAAGQKISFVDRLVATKDAAVPAVVGPDGVRYRISKFQGTFVGIKISPSGKEFINPPAGTKWTAGAAADAVMRHAGGTLPPMVAHPAPVSPLKSWISGHPLRPALEAKLKAGASEAELSADPLVVEALDRMKAMPLTDQMPGYNSLEWWRDRKFVLNGKPATGLPSVFGAIARKMIGLGWTDDGLKAEPVLNGREATIILGPPASGKSTIANAIARQRKAAIVDSDEVKKFFPEYADGLGANAVHEESDAIAKMMLSKFMDHGTNVVVPKVGAAFASIEKIANAMHVAGYKVNIVLMAVTPDEAFRRMIGRFLSTGRLINTTYARAVGYGPRDTYMVLKGGSKADGFATVDNSGPKGTAPSVLEDTGGLLTGVKFGQPEAGGQSGGANAGGLRSGGRGNAEAGAVRDTGGRPAPNDGRGSGSAAEHAFVGYLRGRPFRGETTRPDVGVPVGTPGAPPAVRLTDITNKLIDALDLTLRQGRITKKSPLGKVLGVYDSATGVTRLKERDAYDVLAHEGGHALHLIPRNKAAIDAVIALHASEVENLSYTGPAAPDARIEGFGEWFRMWMTNPAYVEKEAPGFTQAITDWMKRERPEMFGQLQEAQAAYKDWLSAPSKDMVTADIVTSGNPPMTTRVKTAIAGGIGDIKKGQLPGSDRLPTGQSLMSIFGRFYTWVVDRANPTARATEVLQKIYQQNTGHVLDLKRADNPYVLQRLSPLSFQAGHIDLTQGIVPFHGGANGMEVDPVGPSLAEGIEMAVRKDWFQNWRPDDLLDIGGYLAARRMVVEYGRFFAGEVPNPPGKLTLGDYKQAVIDYEKANPNFKQAANLIYAWTKNLLQKELDAGLISQDFFDKAEARSDYVPLMRDFSENVDAAIGMANVSGQNKATIMKTYRGSMRAVINPIESLIQRAYNDAAIMARNDTILSMARLARKAGPGSGAIFEEIPAKQLKPVNLDVMDALKKAGKEAGLNPTDLTDLMLAASEALDSDHFMTTIYKPGDMQEKGEPIVYFWEGGVRKAGRLADSTFGRDVFESLTKIGAEQANWLINFLAVPSRALRMGITTSPAYILANYTRDQVSAFVTNKKFIPFISGASGIIDAVANRRASRLASQSGVIAGGANVASLNEASINRDISALQLKGYSVHYFTSLRDVLKFTEISETGTRLALFKEYHATALKQGLNEYEAITEAAFEANDYMDFNRHGSRMLALRRVVTFLNSAIQGTEKVGRVLFADMKPLAKVFRGEELTRLERNNLGRSAQAWVKVGLLTALSATYSSLVRNDPEYQDASEYLRATSWLIPIGGGNWVAVPKPYEIATFINFGERMVDAIAAHDPTWFDKFLRSTYQTMMVPTEATGLQVPIELAHNYDDFRGGPIVPEWKLGLDPGQQFDQYTSEFSKAVGAKLGVSPAQIDFVLVNWGGSWARDILNVSNMADPQRRSAALYDWPVTSRFVKNLTRGNDATDKFYGLIAQTSGRLQTKLNTYNAYISQGKPDVAATYFSSLKDDEKTWVASQNAGTVDEKRVDPIRRASDVMAVYSGLRQDITERNIKLVFSPGRTITINPTIAAEVNDQLARASAAEARNSMIAIGQPGWAGRQIIDPTPFIDAIGKLDPRLEKELNQRLLMAHILPFAGVQAVYPTLKNRLIQKGPGAFIGDLMGAAMSARTGSYVGGYTPPKQPAAPAQVFSPRG